MEFLDINLCARQWNLLLGFTGMYPWVRILQGLVERSSYRAVYHIRNQLVGHYGHHVAAAEERTWPQPLPVEDIDAELRRDLQACEAFAAQIRDWLTLDHEVTSVWAPMNVLGMTVFRALHAAFLESCQPPERVSPAAVEHATSPHTKAAFEIFEQKFYHFRPSYNIKVGPGSLLNFLENMAMNGCVVTQHGLKVRDVPRLPGWDEWLSAWTRRTVNFLVERRCWEVGEEHEGLHRHGEERWYHPGVWEAQEVVEDVAGEGSEQSGHDGSEDSGMREEDEVEDVPMTVQELGGMMEDAHIS
jgi:hypothetical protein